MMKFDELNDQYRHLRSELDAAYANPVWDSERIDRIADRPVPCELALASLRSGCGDDAGQGASHG